MAVCGNLGPTSYKMSALCSTRKIAEHSLYYFPKGAERITCRLAHVIILIGAEKLDDGQEIIYYNDPSDVGELTSIRKMYVQSYKTFTLAIRSPYLIRAAVYVKGRLQEAPQVYGIHAHRSLWPSTSAARSSMPSLGSVLSKTLIPTQKKTPPTSLSLPSIVDSLIALKILQPEDCNSDE